MFRGFLRFVKVFNVLPNCLCSHRPLFSLERKGPKGRRPRPTVQFELEDLEGRLLLSTSPVGQPPASTPLVAVMDRVDQMIVGMQTEAITLVKAMTQEIVQELAYLQMQLDHIFGIDAASQNTPLNSSMQSSGNGSGNIVAMASNASNQVSNIGALQADNGSGSSNATIKPLDSPGGPDAVGAGDYTWNPVVNGSYLASDPNNWLIGNKPNTQGTVPGDNPQDTVTFDPGGANVTNGNGPIIWDYKATFSEMNVGGIKPYTGSQTIGTLGVELTGGAGTSLNMIQPTSELELNFVGAGSVFVIDNNATITNMALGGSNRGQFNINGGVTTIANQILETLTVNNVQINIAQGAELDDQSHSVLDFTGTDSAINVAGTMFVDCGDSNKATNTLIGNPFGKAGNFINVNGGSLEYAGNGGITDQFQVPVYIQNGGEFVLTSGPNPGGKLIVQGTVPGKANNASVYLTGTGSTVQLSQGVTLEADNDYFQDSGILETWDNSTCTLQDGAAGKGTANITGGTVWIDGLANSYGRLNLIGSLNLGGGLVVSVQGYPYDPANPQEGTSRDQLYVAANLTLNAASTLQVYTYGTLVKNDYWNVITLPNNGVNIGGNFGSESSVPAGANMTYGPPNVPTVGKYRVTFNG